MIAAAAAAVLYLGLYGTTHWKELFSLSDSRVPAARRDVVSLQNTDQIMNNQISKRGFALRVVPRGHGRR